LDSRVPENPRVIPHKLKIVIAAFFMASAVAVLVLGALGWLSLSRVADQASVISKNDLPLMAGIKESHLALGRAQLAAERILEIRSGVAQLDNVAKNEADFRQAHITFDAFAAAMTWGSESDAFAQSDGGIDRYEWKKLSSSQALVMAEPNVTQGQLAGQASIYFAGFTNNANKAIIAHKRFLQLSDAGKVHEAAIAEQQAKEFAGLSRAFATDTYAKLADIEKVSTAEAVSSSHYIDSFAASSQRGILFIALIAALGLGVLGLLFSRYFIVRPMQAILDTTHQLSQGDLSKRVEPKNAGLLGVIIEAFNSLAENLQRRLEDLMTKVKTSTDELEQQHQSAETTQRAMMNLLHDAKDLEEQLKEEKAGVEKKVVARTKELRDEHARLEASVNSLSVGFMMTDDQHKIITLNPRARAILFNEAKVKPEHPEFGDIEKSLKGAYDIRDEINACLKTGKASEKELLFGSRFLHIALAPIVEPGNEQVIGTVILVEDNTEEKVLQRSRDEFFSIASHELRTPLTAIKGNTSMIQQYYSDQLKDESLREMVSDIHDSSNRLIEIVNDFLDVSRLEQGKFTFKNEAFNIAKVIESVIYEIDQVSKEKGIYLKMEGNLDTYPFVYADKDRTKQIVYNLVGNAMKFTEKGGITLSAKIDKKLLKIFVKDTGRGIPQDKQSLLFRKFQQAGNSLLTRDTTRGTGLGLYISKLLSENMGGRVNLEGSEPGKGTTFSFTLPLATPKQLAAGSLEEQSKAQQAVEPKADQPAKA
jgi:signal transduction histidine kinase/methyl-accepting chemotaxis protein